jgi:hypothetical protein
VRLIFTMIINYYNYRVHSFLIYSFNSIKRESYTLINFPQFASLGDLFGQGIIVIVRFCLYSAVLSDILEDKLSCQLFESLDVLLGRLLGFWFGVCFRNDF